MKKTTINLLAVMVLTATPLYAAPTSDYAYFMDVSMNRSFSPQNPTIGAGILYKDIIEVGLGASRRATYSEDFYSVGQMVEGTNKMDHYTASMQVAGSLGLYKQLSISLGATAGYLKGAEANLSAFPFMVICAASTPFATAFSTLNYRVTQRFSVYAGAEAGKTVDRDNGECVNNPLTAQTIAGLRFIY